MTPLEVVILILASAAAGVVNAIAGGGTLITFPALLILCRTPALIANATSTLALVVGTAGSIYGFRTEIPIIRSWLVRFLPVSIAGGWVGSLLLTCTSNEAFSRLVPYLLLFATALFITQSLFRKIFVPSETDPAPRAHATPRALWVAIVFQFAVAVYGGYFGAGIGILMLASLGFLGLTNIHQMNALKNVLGSLINLVAALWFIWSGLIDWPKMLVMSIGAMAGYYVGAHYSLRIPQARVRQIIAGVGFAISGILFLRQWH